MISRNNGPSEQWIVGMISRHNRTRTEPPRHNRPNKVGDYVRFLYQ